MELTLKQRLHAYAQLTRLDKPIGSLLLMWPTLWSLWLAASGVPSLHLLLVFIFGVLVMRSAGCIINDFADRDLDGQVKRTSQRPLACGRIDIKEAKLLFAVLVLCAFLLVISLNSYTIALAFVGLGVTIAYPFMKRFTHLPQFVLGIAFSWPIPMVFAATSQHVPAIAWLLFSANYCWIIAYDTCYAMVDRDDDLKIGIKSTAILFGRYDRLWIGIFQLLTLLLLAVVGYITQLSSYFWLALIAMFLFFSYQQYLIHNREREKCFKAFLNNNYAGLCIFAGLVGHFARL